MKKLSFNCTLKTDIILTGNSATEGFQTPLSFIPGAKFWGIAANNIFRDNDNTGQLKKRLFSNAFHFGDARPLIDNNPSLKVPLVWITTKGNENNPEEAPIYLSHKLSPDDRDKLTADQGQLKQMRQGFFEQENKKFFNPSHSFYLKSAYDHDKRKANDGQMFGYHSLPSGSKWQFDVVAEDIEELEIVTKALTGIKRIGRSRSAEFGLVNIEPSGKLTLFSPFTVTAGAKEVLLYAQSNLCFLNKFGQNVIVPDACMLQDFGCPPGSAIAGESKIRHRLYQSWNTKRFNRDHDRQIVEAGSVFIIKLPKNAPAFEIPPIIGSYQNEGFGAILVNPDFLLCSSFELNFKLKPISDISVEKNKKAKIIDYPDIGSEDILLQTVLKLRQKQHTQFESIDGLVNDFIKNNQPSFNKVTASQWGILRNLANGSNSDEILDRILFGLKEPGFEGFLFKGSSAGQWKEGAGKLKQFLFDNKKIKELPNTISARQLLTKLASQISKENKKEGENA